MHGVGDTVKEIDDPEEPHEAPSLQIRIKGQVHHHGRGDDADDEPGLEFAPPGSRLFNNVSHDGIVQSDKDTGCHHDGRNGSELRIGQGPGKQDEGHETVGEQVVDGVPPDGTNGKQDQISFQLFFFHMIKSSPLSPSDGDCRSKILKTSYRGCAFHVNE